MSSLINRETIVNRCATFHINECDEVEMSTDTLIPIIIMEYIEKSKPLFVDVDLDRFL